MFTKAEYKIIADHLRSSCFLMADGIMPSNEGRGYVLRRIMRRAMRQLHKMGAREASMYKLVDALIHEMGGVYPELSRAREVLIETLKNEEEKFRETLEKGLKILEEEVAKIKESTPLPGAVAFKLYDTYGFPLDLTQDILKEKNLTVDLEGFNREMESQRERAKANWKGSGEEKEDGQFLKFKDEFGATKFLGYEKLEEKAKVIAVTASGIVLDHTPFYATSGGQKGDDGKIILASSSNKNINHPNHLSQEKKEAHIIETKKFGGSLFVHFLDSEKQNYNFKIGDEVIAQVNTQNRARRACNHSATHLMHKALKEVLGNSISQKGSNVDVDYFTFDFNFNRAMTADEKQKVEDLVNNYIKQNSAVKTEVMPLEQAHKSGAEALFGEKYDSDVRVVSMSPSIELCGGTHVKNTGEIEAFKIISEGSVAAGIRRVTAISGNEAVEKFKQNELQKAQEEAQRQEQKEKEKELEKQKKQKLFASLGELKSQKLEQNSAEINLLSHVFEDVDAKDLREIAVDLKQRKDFYDSHIFALFGTKEDKVAVCVAVSNNLLDKFDATKLITPMIETIGGKGGGGKKDLAMGGGVNKDAIPQAIEILKKL